jgi:S-disulfanyl-L-cysteine oxidoreductase SoxD
VKLIVPGAILLLVVWTAQFRARAQGHPSTRDGVYTETQATRGQASYKKACASCHTETLEGSGAAIPPLAGEDFTMNWTGQTVDDLFERIQTSMPADRPGTLSRTENADILAYILKVNKLPAGQNELPGDAEALKPIQFEAAKK